MIKHASYCLLLLLVFVAQTAFSQYADSLVNTYLDSARIFDSLNKNQQAYLVSQKALNLLQAAQKKDPLKIASTESNMGTYAYQMGNVALSEKHHRKALQIFQSLKIADNENIYLSGNNMGGIMWFAMKTDSALYFFNLALGALSKMKPTAQNQYYRPAVLQNNMAAIYGSDGNTTEAIAAMKSSITNIKNYLAIKSPLPKLEQAKHLQFEATDNLAGFYKELGDYRQAHDLLYYSWQQKQKNFKASDPAIFKSQILLGQLYYAMREFDKAKQFLEDGLKAIAMADGDFLFWQADAYNTLSLLYDEQKNAKQAAIYFEQADKLYDESLQGDYDDIYLDFLRNAAMFYAENNNSSKALQKANKSYRYLLSTQKKQSLPLFYQVVNLAEVHYELHNYRDALHYSKEALNMVDVLSRRSSNMLDSIKVLLKKPRAVLVKAKSDYQLQPLKTIPSLKATLKELDGALDILERRRVLISDAHDLNLLLADNEGLLQFMKKITLELYRLSGESTYLEQLMDLHESALYTRIRSRFEKSDTLSFANLPAEVKRTEDKLKNSLNILSNSKGSHEQNIEAYFKSLDNWNHFLENLRTDHPRYYRMRYAAIFKTLGEVQRSIPPNTTVIRYIFVEKKLFALVADSNTKQLVEMDTSGIDNTIALLTAQTMDIENTSAGLHKLYRQLWAPLSNNIRHRKIIVIPDGILYNLNFEILTPQKIKRFADMAEKSLLANYTISYHYSLFLLEQEKKSIHPKNNFVGFAPGFFDPMKTNYRNLLKDTTDLDNYYLSLLPQPFSVNIITKTWELLGGSLYVEEKGSLQSFKDNAGMHKIIHIATHAESNNLQPQYSRLIFAKSLSAKQENNSLYLFDIYNCDLRSDLTVLTACESGKAGHEDGEGMISLAHAFHYAGSESMLTGLWKIDEQSSAILMDHFYKNLSRGLSKDEALRQAKLEYLRNSKGRILSPRYWAGLVLMGNTSPIILQSKGSYKQVMIAVISLLAIFAGFIAYKKFAK